MKENLCNFDHVKKVAACICLKRSKVFSDDLHNEGVPHWPRGTYLQTGAFLMERRAFMLKSRMPQLEYTMNIFYIIGVVVVVLFVAGFLGLR